MLRQAGQVPRIVGDDQNVATAIFPLFVMGEPTFFFHQALDEMPVGFVLGAIGSGNIGAFQLEPVMSTCLRMVVEDVSENVLGPLVLPDPCVLAKAQEMQPGTKRDLAEIEFAVTAQALCGMHVAMPGQRLAFMLPEPQRDWLRNQLLQRNPGMRAKQIDGDFVAVIESLGGDQPLWQEDVWPEWRVQLEQPAMLRDARLGAW